MVATKSSILAVAASLSVPLAVAAPIDAPVSRPPYGLGPEVPEGSAPILPRDTIDPSLPAGTGLPRVQPLVARQDDSSLADAGVEAGINAGSQALADLIVKKRSPELSQTTHIQPILPRRTDDSGLADAGIKAGIDAGSQAIADLIVKKRQDPSSGRVTANTLNQPGRARSPPDMQPHTAILPKRQQDVGEGAVDTAELLGAIFKRQDDSGVADAGVEAGIDAGSQVIADLIV